MGQKFKMLTDHINLLYLWEQHISTLQQEKWLVKLMAYDFVIEYKQGKENIVADVLSSQSCEPL